MHLYQCTPYRPRLILMQRYVLFYVLSLMTECTDTLLSSDKLCNSSLQISGGCVTLHKQNPNYQHTQMSVSNETHLPKPLMQKGAWLNEQYFKNIQTIYTQLFPTEISTLLAM